MANTESKVVAYIDLLAFSNYIKENTSDALECFMNYNTIISKKIRDSQRHPVDSYCEELQELAKNTSLNAIEHLFPFSDSIFIVAKEPTSLMYQISSFLLQTY